MSTIDPTQVMTLKEFAESVRIDPKILLRRIQEAGLSAYSLESSLTVKDKQKIINALRPPKRRSARKVLGKKNTAKAHHKARKGPTAASPAGGKTGRRKETSAGLKKKEAAGSVRSKRTSTKRQATAKPPLTPPARVHSKVASVPQQKEKAQQREKKNKRTRSQEIQNIVDKNIHRYGLRVTREDIAEIEEIMGKNVHKDSGKSPDAAQQTNIANMRIENRHKFIKPAHQKPKEIELTDRITVSELAVKMAVKTEEIKKQMHKSGFDRAEDDQVLDRDTATLLVEELGHRADVAKPAPFPVISDEIPESAQTEPRPPIVTVMGHVDHGKTTLLDYLRKSKLAEQEAGNITQHLGAYTITVNKGKITFLDTPGHAAFSAMRARGSKITDIVVLVIAADDGIMPQTIEAIQHAAAAGTAIIVAINKTDISGVDTKKIRQDATAHGLRPDDMGGETQFVEISAKTGKGIDTLLEAILLRAELLDLRASFTVPARGRVLESRLDKNMGPVATLLVGHGILKKGDNLYSGGGCGRIKIMRDDSGRALEKTVPGEAVEVFGLSHVPQSGDVFVVCASEKEARKLAENYHKDLRQKTTVPAREFDVQGFLQGGVEEKLKINLIVKADVTGSLEAISSLFASLTEDPKVREKNMEINLVAKGVGAITATDVALAQTAEALVIGFNVRPDSAAKKLIKQSNFDKNVHYFGVIYELGNELQRVMEERSLLRGTEKVLGVAEVREVFRAKTYGQIAGCMVTEGCIYKEKPIRVLRDNRVIYEGVLESLRRFKEDVTEVQKEVECGIGVKDYKDVRVGDQIEVYDKKLPVS